jgi:hypothetical protein
VLCCKERQSPRAYFSKKQTKKKKKPQNKNLVTVHDCNEDPQTEQKAEQTGAALRIAILLPFGTTARVVNT